MRIGLRLLLGFFLILGLALFVVLRVFIVGIAVPGWGCAWSAKKS